MSVMFRFIQTGELKIKDSLIVQLNLMSNDFHLPIICPKRRNRKAFCTV